MVSKDKKAEAKEKYHRLAEELKRIPDDRKHIYIRGFLADISDPEVKVLLENTIEIANFSEIGHRKHVIVLIHGIRTRAEWQSMIASELSSIGPFDVRPLGYGFLDVARFWFPFKTRNGPIDRIRRELRAISSANKNNEISVIAHSFGTYIIGKILENDSDVVLYRLVLCGSIIETNYRWDNLAHLPNGRVINDCGTQDILPVIANSVSWGYGPSGRFGFQSANVVDRYHNVGHSGFFTNSFVRKYWSPFFESGDIIRSADEANRRKENYFISLLPIIPVKTIFLFIFLFLSWKAFAS